MSSSSCVVNYKLLVKRYMIGANSLLLLLLFLESPAAVVDDEVSCCV